MPSEIVPTIRVRSMLCVAILAGMPVCASAQDSTRATLPTIRVTGTREGPRAPLELPYAVTLSRPDSLAALRRASVDELLFAVPGVALANRQNPAQDPRISIRGFGSRSAFGVRGVRVLQDGIPASLPDGQTPVDALDIEDADRVEVIRGTASSLYGNGAGGVIDIRSAPPTLFFEPFARVVGGNRTPTITAMGASGTIDDNVGVTSSLTHIVGGGYRDYSDQNTTRGAMRMLFGGNENQSAPLVLSARFSDVSHAQSPGALTRALFDADPHQADPFSVQKGAGKSVQQEDLSLVGQHGLFSSGTIDASAFVNARTLDNPTTQAIIEVKRASGGTSLRLNEHGSFADHDVRFTTGIDAQWVNDDRQEYANCIGVTCAGGFTVEGAIQKNQRELVGGLGPYVRGEIALMPNLLASAGVRRDEVQFTLRDRLITSTNPDDSGERTMDAVSPSVGLVWRATPLASIYANVSQSFDTPTTTELGNKEDGSAGINPNLQPQTALNYEIGTKGLWLGRSISWDIAAFESHVQNELVPFDIPNGNGRRYYRNAGQTQRRGGEFGIDAEAGALAIHTAYEYSHFRYVTYVAGTTSYAGNRIPGIPEQTLASTVSYRLGETRLSATADLAGPADVDDGNSAQAPGHAVFGVAVGRDVRVGGTRLSPLVALQNVGGVRYAGSLSVNATGGKFYEPAPGRTLFVRFALARDR